MHKDILYLQELGYKTRQCSPYHYHVYFDDTLLNIWISNNGKKWMPEVSQPSTEWNEVSEIVDIIKQRTNAKDEHGIALNEILARLKTYPHPPLATDKHNKL